METPESGQYGPIYPNLGTKIAKMRAVKHPTREQRRAHGEAVLEAIRSLQRQELQRQFVGSRPNCASRTAHTTGKTILKAIRDRQTRALEGALAESWRCRSDVDLVNAYDEAMNATRIERAKAAEHAARAAKAEVRAAAKATVGKVEEFLKAVR